MEFKFGQIVEIISEKEFEKFKLSDSYKKLRKLLCLPKETSIKFERGNP